MNDQPTLPAERCTAHDGAHPVYLGHCHAFGAQVRRPARFGARPVICQECGAEQDAKRLGGGRVVLLSAGTDRPHWHPKAPTVEIDEDRLAGAIVTASRAAREERRADERQRASSAPHACTVRPPDGRAEAQAANNGPAGPPARTIPAVTVWSPPGLDDGTSE